MDWSPIESWRGGAPNSLGSFFKYNFINGDPYEKMISICCWYVYCFCCFSFDYCSSNSIEIFFLVSSLMQHHNNSHNNLCLNHRNRRTKKRKYSMTQNRLIFCYSLSWHTFVCSFASWMLCLHYWH